MAAQTDLRAPPARRGGREVSDWSPKNWFWLWGQSRQHPRFAERGVTCIGSFKNAAPNFSSGPLQ